MSSLLNLLGGGRSGGVVHGQAAAIGNSLGTSLPIGAFFNNQLPSLAPKAYLNMIFFDDQFNFVGEVSDFRRVSQAGAAPNDWLSIDEVRAVKNGYVYIYISNASNVPVWFDNFEVKHVRGRLIEENHYYPYGLKIAALSSRAVAGSISTDIQKLGYQGAYAEEVGEFDLGYNEFQLRNYDPQIGRFINADPYDQFASPYVGMGNDPANGVDPSGGIFGGLSTLASMAVGAIAGGVFGMAADFALGGDGGTGAAVGFVGGALYPVFGLSTLFSGASIESSAFTSGAMNSATSNNVSCNPKEQRSIQKYGRLFNKELRKLGTDTEENRKIAHELVFLKHADEDWLWILEDCENNGYDRESRDPDHGTYFYAGDLFEAANTKQSPAPLSNIGTGTGRSGDRYISYQVPSTGKYSVSVSTTGDETWEVETYQSRRPLIGEVNPSVEAALRKLGVSSFAAPGSLAFLNIDLNISRGIYLILHVKAVGGTTSILSPNNNVDIKHVPSIEPARPYSVFKNGKQHNPRKLSKETKAQLRIKVAAKRGYF